VGTTSEITYLFDVESILGFETLHGLCEVKDAELELPVFILQLLDCLRIEGAIRS
jgi:hypothetical protein